MPPLSKPTAVVRLTRVLRRPEACAPNRSLRGCGLVIPLRANKNESPLHC